MHTLERTRGRVAVRRDQASAQPVDGFPAGRSRLADRAPYIDSRELSRERLLFESSTRGPLHERNLVQRAFKPLVARAGLPDTAQVRKYAVRGGRRWNWMDVESSVKPHPNCTLPNSWWRLCDFAPNAIPLADAAAR